MKFIKYYPRWINIDETIDWDEDFDWEEDEPDNKVLCKRNYASGPGRIFTKGKWYEYKIDETEFYPYIIVDNNGKKRHFQKNSTLWDLFDWDGKFVDTNESFDFNEDDFDYEEEDDNIKLGDKVTLSKSCPYYGTFGYETFKVIKVPGYKNKNYYLRSNSRHTIFVKKEDMIKEDINFDDDWDYEEEYEDFKVGDKLYLPKGVYNIQTANTTSTRHVIIRGVINGDYESKLYSHNKYGTIDEIVKRNDGVKVFRFKSEWPFREFTNWVKVKNESIDWGDWEDEEEYLTKEDLKNSVIRVSSQSNYNKLMKLFDKLGITWVNDKASMRNYFNKYKDFAICVKNNMRLKYSNYGFYKKIQHINYKFYNDVDIIDNVLIESIDWDDFDYEEDKLPEIGDRIKLKNAQAWFYDRNSWRTLLNHTGFIKDIKLVKDIDYVRSSYDAKKKPIDDNLPKDYDGYMVLIGTFWPWFKLENWEYE